MRLVIAALLLSAVVLATYDITDVVTECDEALNTATECGSTCGYIPKIVGDCLAQEFYKAHDVVSFKVKGNGECGDCKPCKSLKCWTALDADGDWEYCGEIVNDPGCGDYVEIECNHKRRANFGKCCCEDQEGGSHNNLFCGDEWYNGTIPCAGKPGKSAASFVKGAWTCPTMPVGGYDSGSVCYGTCAAHYHKPEPQGPRATCVDGKWVYEPCVADWPVHPHESCVQDLKLAGQEVVTPWFVESYPRIEDADATSSKLAMHRDNLHLKFYFNASYGVMGLTSFGSPYPGAVSTINTVLVSELDSTYEKNVERFYLKFYQPVDCLAIIELVIPIGELDTWGFKLSEENGIYYLNGQLYVNSTRLVEVTGRISEQRVDANFPIRIRLNREFIVDLSCELEMYGPPNAKAVIILFRESPYPFQDLTVWILWSNQYPFQLKVPLSGFSSSHTWNLNGLITASEASVHPHRCLADHCCIDDISPTQEHYCYQVLKIKFAHSGRCAMGPVKYTGRNSLTADAACRKNPLPLPSPAWCQLPNEYVSNKVYFDWTSNDICLVDLYYNPLLNVKAFLEPYLVMPTPNVFAEPDCCGFVSGNDAWFMIHLKTAYNKYMELAITSLQLLNLTIGLKEDLWTVYQNSAWLVNPGVSHMFPSNEYKQLYCNAELISAHPECVMDGYPVIYWKIKIDPVFFNLINWDLPKEFAVQAGVRVTYDYKGETRVLELKASTINAQGFFIVSPDGIEFPEPFVPQTIIVASASNAGFVYVGLGATIAVAGIAVALFIFKKKSASAPQKLEETTA